MDIEKSQQEIELEQYNELKKQRDQLRDSLIKKRKILFTIVSHLEDLDFDCDTLCKNEVLPDGFK